MKRSVFTPVVKQENVGNLRTSNALTDYVTNPLSDRMIFPSMVPLPRNALTDVGHHFSSPVPNSANHVCRVCEKVFRASSLLDIHMRVHVGAKPFVCPVCGHRATQKGNLKLHMKKHHGAELPPHIDLVPDSGIWGHPQKNFPLSCFAGPFTEGVDSNNNNNSGESPGKCKQVVQAVSSLLDEEVVELIKKYQDDSGQGAAGTITESLEDFIRIAKSKAASDARMATVGELPVATEEKYDPLRFQSHADENGPFSSESTKRPPLHAQRTENFVKFRSCALCGRARSSDQSFNKLHLVGFEGAAKLPLCDNCLTVQGYVQLLPSYASNQAPESRDKPISTVSTADGPSKEGPEKCSFRFTLVEDLASLENSEKRSFPAKTASINPKKERLLPGVGLIAEPSAAKENSERPDGDAVGHASVVSRLKLPDSKERSKSFPDVSNMESGRPGLLKAMSKRGNLRKRPRSCDLELESRPKRTRASPDVLNLLRRTLLHSTDQKMASAQWADEKSGDVTLAASNGRDQNPAEAFSYRNPAMQSLAQIGKWNVAPETNHQMDCNNRQNGSMVLMREDALDLESNGYRCRFCQKWFKYRSVLEIHLRSHTGERPFKCPYCEYAGTQLNCLKLHFQRHHPAEYAASPPKSAASLRQNHEVAMSKGSACFSPVNCPICGRASPSPGYLKIHMRSHKKSLDHVCHICGRGFKQYWYLSTHLKTHERELNALKRNEDQCKARLAMARSSRLVSEFSRNSLPDARFNNPHEESRLMKCPELSNRPVNKDYRNQSQAPPESTQNGEHALAKPDHGTGSGYKILNPVPFNASLSRSRRRKAACPSRVVSTPSIPKSPVSERSVANGVASVQEPWRTQREKVEENIEGEMPLDLRCEAKKMSDSDKRKNLPMNLCKL